MTIVDEGFRNEYANVARQLGISVKGSMDRMDQALAQMLVKRNEMQADLDSGLNNIVQKDVDEVTAYHAASIVDVKAWATAK